MSRLPMHEIILNSQNPQLRNASHCHLKKYTWQEKNKMKNKISAYLLKVIEVKKYNRVNIKYTPQKKMFFSKAQ